MSGLEHKDISVSFGEAGNKTKLQFFDNKWNVSQNDDEKNITTEVTEEYDAMNM